MIIEEDTIDSVAIYPDSKKVRVTVAHRFIDSNTNIVKAQNLQEMIFFIGPPPNNIEGLRAVLGQEKADLLAANI